MSKEKRRVPKLRFPGFTEDWDQRKLGDVTNIKTGSRNQQDSVTNGQYPFFIRSEKIEKLDRYDFDTEAILVPGDGRIGEIFHYYNGKFALHQRVYKVDNFKGVDAFFLLYLFQCSFKEHALRLNAQGTVPSLRLPMFTEWNICIPSLQEQIGIGRLLNKIELMITLHQRKLDNLKLKKKALLQKLFPKNGEYYPELRFPGFTDAWEQRKLSDISTKVTTKNVDVHYTETLTNSAEQGIISQVDFFDKEISNKDNINGYYIVDNNDFIYNPRISTLAPVGPINRNKLNRTGIMSPLYTVFRSSNVDLGFLEWYFQSSHWHRYMKLNGDSGARADRIAIKDSTFFEMPIKIPVNIKEQVLIGETLEKFNQYITLHQRKLDHLQLQKKALLQQMFV